MKARAITKSGTREEGDKVDVASVRPEDEEEDNRITNFIPDSSSVGVGFRARRGGQPAFSGSLSEASRSLLADE
jgi:hypothetical protein